MKKIFNFAFLMLMSFGFMSIVDAAIYPEYSFYKITGENDEVYHDSVRYYQDTYVYVGGTESSEINFTFFEPTKLVGDNPQALITFANYNDEEGVIPVETKLYGGVGNEMFLSTNYDFNNDIVAVGYTTTDGNNVSDIYKALLVKYDIYDHEVKQEVTLSEETSNKFEIIEVDMDGNYILSLVKTDTSGKDIPYLYKTNSDFEEIFKTEMPLDYENGEQGSIDSIKVTPNNEYIITLSIQNERRMYSKVMKYSSTGGKIWEQSPVCTADNQFYTDIELDKNNNIFIAGNCGNNGQLLKYSNSGSLLKTLTTSNEEYKTRFDSVKIGADGYGYIVLNQPIKINSKIYRFSPSTLTLGEKIIDEDESIFYTLNIDEKSNVLPSGYKVYSNTGQDAYLRYLLNLKPTVTQVGSTSLKITFNSGFFDEYNQYKIYYSTSKTGTYKYLKTITSEFNSEKPVFSSSYIHTGLTPGKTYYYKLKAVNTTTTPNVISNLSEYNYATVRLIAPSTLNTSSTYNSVKLSWSKVSNASGYKIYRSTSKTGTYSLIKTITSPRTTTYTNTGLTTGKTYYYKIKSYKVVSKKYTYSSYSSIKSIKLDLNNPTISASDSYYKYVKISVTKKTPGASGYKYYRGYDINNDGNISLNEYTYLGKTSKTYFYDYKGAKNKTYSYKVIPYRYISKSNIYTGASSTTNNGTRLNDSVEYVVTSGNYDRINIKINKLPKVTKYYIYYATSKTGKYYLAKTLYASNYKTKEFVTWTHTDRTFNKTYYYKIKPSYYNTGSYSKTLYVKTKLLSNGFSIYTGGSFLTTSFNIAKVSNASGYEIERSTEMNGVYHYIGRTSTTTFSYELTREDYQANDKTYYYRVRAYKIVNGKKIYGDYSTSQVYVLE